MYRSFRDLVDDYRRDPYFPTPMPFALLYALGDVVWFRLDGTPRALKPSNWSNPVSRWLNRSLFRPGYSSRKLTLRERILLALGF